MAIPVKGARIIVEAILKTLGSLYAISWESIDDCNGKIEVPSTKVASRLFEQTQSKFRFQNIASRRVA